MDASQAGSAAGPSRTNTASASRSAQSHPTQQDGPRSPRIPASSRTFWIRSPLERGLLREPQADDAANTSRSTSSAHRSREQPNLRTLEEQEQRDARNGWDATDGRGQAQGGRGRRDAVQEEGAVDGLARVYRTSTAWLAGRKLDKREVDELLHRYRTIASAGTASLVSTAAAFPVKYYPSIWACGRAVLKEEGLKGFFRGVWIPLITISFVRTSSFSIYVSTKEALHRRGIFAEAPNNLVHTALSGAAGGATSGVLISCGSAPFELVKVQRQLEYLTAVQQGLISSKDDAKGGNKYRAQSGFQAASNIWKNHRGPRGFYLGFPLHICRDTLGTALYFGFYDTIRAVVGRHTTTKPGSAGSAQLWGLPGPVVSFLSGSTAGIASWLLVYPVDLLKTNVQQRALSNHPQQLTGWQLFQHLMREKTVPGGSSKGGFVRRFLRLYRGLGVSALRSFVSHGLTWSLIETIQARIDERTRYIREDGYV